MPAQIVVVKRPRGGLFALVWSAPAWLRAVWSGDRVGESRRPCPARTFPRGPDAPPASTEASDPATDAGESVRAVGLAVDEDSLRAALAEHGVQLERSRDGMLRLEVAATESTAVLRRLRDEAAFGFDRLLDLTVVDRSVGPRRFEVVYLLSASASASGVRLRVHATGLEPDAPEIATAVLLWPAADWLEREAHDLFGVRFRGHPGLQRILLPSDFEGAPLRKDFVRDAPKTPETPSARDAPAYPEGGVA